MRFGAAPSACRCRCAPTTVSRSAPGAAPPSRIEVGANGFPRRPADTPPCRPWRPIFRIGAGSASPEGRTGPGVCAGGAGRSAAARNRRRQAPGRRSARRCPDRPGMPSPPVPPGRPPPPARRRASLHRDGPESPSHTSRGPPVVTRVRPPRRPGQPLPGVRPTHVAIVRRLESARVHIPSFNSIGGSPSTRTHVR